MIKFGTDGWRGIISDTFTFSNVRLVSQGLADLINKDKNLPKKIAVGFDRRFLSKEFALEVAKVMMSNDIAIKFSQDFLPTPVLSWAAKNIEGLAGSVVITASHNPFHYNGFKFKEVMGCSALPETTKKIELALEKYSKSGKTPKASIGIEGGKKKGYFEYFNPINSYISSIKQFVDCENIGKFKGKVLIDPMNGSGSDHLLSIIKSLGVDASQIHSERDPLFRGVNPEPVENNLSETINICKSTKPELAIILDGDSDRIGAIDENGNFFNTQQVYSLVVWCFLKRAKEKGAVGKTVSTTHTVNRLAEKYNTKIVQTPIGFKYLAKKMIEGEIFIGGEESGGIGVTSHLPERDPLLVSLILLDIVSSEQKGLSAIYNDICKEAGYAVFLRKDYEITDKIRTEINSRLKKNPPSVIDGKKVKSLSNIDGFKFLFSDESWVLIRTSGTEAVLRIYAEADTKENSEKLIESAKNSLKIKNLKK